MATHALPGATEISIRPAAFSDALDFAELATQLGYSSTLIEVEKRLTAVLDDPRHLVLAAESSGCVVGWAHAYICCLVESDMFAELGGLVVDESARGQGAGGKLLAKIEEWARDQGCAVVSMRSNVIRHRAHKFYEAHGFERTKTQHSFRKFL
jgi:GNAT superfamily N-acetyltransferase